MENGGSDVREPLQGRRKRPWSLVDFLVQFRWVLVVPIVLPISWLYQVQKDFFDWWSNRKSFSQREREHAENVEKVVKRLRARDRQRDGLVCTARAPYLAVAMRNSDYKRARRYEVDLSAFYQILNIDTVNRIARVEPYVTMGQLSAVTVPLGFALEVVPELDDLTVGGLINGYGIEGSSHIYGLFQDTIVAYEIVLGDGKLVRATADNEFSDLFYAIPWSQGTLGLLLAAEIRMIPVKKYMKLRYIPSRGTLKELAQNYIDSFVPPDRDASKIPDFVEGMIYTPTTGVNMVGTYVDEAEAKQPGHVINQCGWWWKPWFYQHAEQALTKGEFVEYIPTREYYHRHTRSLYWEGKLILPFGDQFWFRLLMGWMMPPKVSFLKFTQGEAIRNYYHERHVCQDLLVPINKIGDALELNDKDLEIYPIWLCPHLVCKTPMRGFINPEPDYLAYNRNGDNEKGQMYTDIGLYYAPGAVLRGEEFDGAAACHRLEQWLIENKCFQPQYAVTELSEKDFWRMFDNRLYFQCREKYGAVGTFMSAYYKSKKGAKSEKEVMDEERKERDTAEAESEA